MCVNYDDDCCFWPKTSLNPLISAPDHVIVPEFEWWSDVDMINNIDDIIIRSDIELIESKTNIMAAPRDLLSGHPGHLYVFFAQAQKRVC